MKETITDYETVEKERTITRCDECGKQCDNSYTLGLHPYTRNHRNKHAAVYQLDWCEKCLKRKTDISEYVPPEAELKDVDFSVTPPEVTVEKKSIMPAYCLRDPAGHHWDFPFLFPLGIVILFASDERDTPKYDDFRAGVAQTILGILLWVGVPTAWVLL